MGKISTQRVSHAAGYDAGILPPLGSNHRYRLRKFIISPYDPRYRAWKTFLSFFVLYTAWAAPFEFGFLNEPRRPLSIIDNVVNGFFLLDIVLTFFVAYLDTSTYLLVDDPNKIARRYAFSLRMWFDIISSLPSELVEKIFPHVYGLHSMLRLWRLSMVGSIFSSLEEDRRLNYIGVRCLKLSLVTLFYVHISGCIYFHIATCNHDPKNTWIGISTIGNDFRHVSIWTQYAVSVYWAISTLSSVGYRDPVNRSEMLYNIIYILLNMGLMAYLVGSMTNLIAHSSIRTKLHRESIQAVSTFAQRNQLPYMLQEQMVSHICFKYRMNSEGMQQQEILDSFPKPIRSNISQYLFYSLVENVYLFRGVSTDLIFQLVSEMKTEFYSANEDVILQNETPTGLYIVVSGSVDLMIGNGGEVVGEVREGDLFGEISLVCNRSRNMFTVRTKGGLCQVLRLDRAAFFNIVKSGSVEDGCVIMNNLLRYLNEQKTSIEVMGKVLVEIESRLRHGRILELINLHFAAQRGDDLLMQRLLKHQHHQQQRGGSGSSSYSYMVDESEESSGRTALHVVASNGNEKCVRLLLDHNADPNCNDHQGRTPLWEAVLGGHLSVVKMLVEKGGDINAGDIGQLACVVAHKNNLDLLTQIVQNLQGDVTRPSVHDCDDDGIHAGDTAVDVAISQGNVDMVEYLVKQGCYMGRPNATTSHSPLELVQQVRNREMMSTTTVNPKS